MTDHTICPECKGPMKPLFGAKMFCPQDCDKPEVLAARKAKAAAEAEEAEEKDKKQGSWGGYIFAKGWSIPVVTNTNVPPNQIYITGNKVTGTPATRHGIAITPSTPAKPYPRSVTGATLVLPSNNGTTKQYPRSKPCPDAKCRGYGHLYAADLVEVAAGKYEYWCASGLHGPEPVSYPSPTQGTFYVP